MWYKCLRSFTCALFDKWSGSVDIPKISPNISAKNSSGRIDLDSIHLFENAFEPFNTLTLKQTEKKLQKKGLKEILAGFLSQNQNPNKSFDKTEVKSLS